MQEKIKQRIKYLESSLIVSEEINSNIRRWFSFIDEEGDYYKVILKPFEL